MPCESVTAVRGRIIWNCIPQFTCTAVPFTVIVVVVCVGPEPRPVPAACPAWPWASGATDERLTFALRIGDPVSLATTRPRMVAVPLGSGGGRRAGSRTGWPACAGGGGGGGGS